MSAHGWVAEHQHSDESGDDTQDDGVVRGLGDGPPFGRRRADPAAGAAVMELLEAALPATKAQAEHHEHQLVLDHHAGAVGLLERTSAPITTPAAQISPSASWFAANRYAERLSMLTVERLAGGIGACLTSTECMSTRWLARVGS